MFRLSSLLKLPIPLPQVGVGPEIKTATWDCETILKRWEKSRFKSSDCCLAMSFVPAWMIILFVCGCELKMSGIFPVMSVTVAPGNDTVNGRASQLSPR